MILLLKCVKHLNDNFNKREQSKTKVFRRNNPWREAVDGRRNVQ